ncbi:MAG: sigma 54-interacting transcriptional regulator [Acidobacteriota bacterium]
MSASVLVVEDEIIVQRHLCRILERLGLRVIGTATNGRDAVRLARQERPDLALMDIRLQGPMDGIEVAGRLRRELDVAIVFLTAYADAKTLERTRTVEAVGYLVKPFEEDDVRAAVTTALTKERAVRRIEEHGRDLRSILDQLEVGTAMLDDEGRMSFLSRPATRLLGLDAATAHGEPWRRALPFDAETSARLARLIDAEPSQRDRLPATVDSGAGSNARSRRLLVDVRDDPRASTQRILFFYDVTETHELQQILEGRERGHGMVGRSPVMLRVFEQIDRVAASAAPVLVEGETGSGKELVARAVHHASPRASGPFIAVNCAGLTESLLASQLFGHRRGAFTGAVADHRGVFELANGGTLFLDEIGDISMSVQTSLLRVLEDSTITPLGATTSREVDVRIVTATHQDLNAAVEAGGFRADLLYRIRVARLRLPPLRERGEDVELLAHVFLDRCRATAGRAPMRFSAGALEQLVRHPWPGNVRELRSAIEHAVIFARTEEITTADLPPEVASDGLAGPPTTAHGTVRRSEGDERRRIVEALERTGGNRSRAAKLLGISRATFYRRLDQLGIE